MGKRIVQFASVWYHVDGRQELAHRGHEIDFTDEEEQRLEGLGALAPSGAEEPTPPVGYDLTELTVDSTDEEIKMYLDSGTVREITEQAKEYPPSLVNRLLELENSRQTPRKGLVDALGKQIENEQPAPSDPDTIQPLTQP